MRRVALCFVSIGLLAIAAPRAAHAVACMADTMANYLNLGAAGCTVEDKIFRKYFYDSRVVVNGNPLTDPVTGKVLVLPAPATVQVAPIQAINPPPNSFNLGLEFSSTAWSLSGALVEVHNVLTISCNANANCMAQVSGLENRFSEVMPAPEPASLALVVTGLLAFGTARRRGIRTG